MMLDSRNPLDRDDTPVMITRGMLKQLLRQLLGSGIEIPFVEEEKLIIGILAIGGKLEIAYADGTIEQVVEWADTIDG